MLFIGAGCLHFLFPDLYTAVVPAYLPYPRALVLISGVCEILGGVGVVVPTVRRFAGYGLIALLIAVFPANIDMAMKSVYAHGLPLASLLLIARLPLQFLLIAWVHKAACQRKQIPIVLNKALEAP